MNNENKIETKLSYLKKRQMFSFVKNGEMKYIYKYFFRSNYIYTTHYGVHKETRLNKTVFINDSTKS